MDLGQQLEELKQENLALKQQLQEPDLKAFEQIRELRTTHKKLTDEVKRVTTECVQLSFKVKQAEAEAKKQAADVASTREQLERTESELQSCRNDLENRTQELQEAQAKIAQLEDEFGTLQQDLAAKVQLGQQLEHSLEEAQHQIADRNSALQGHQDELSRQKDELQRRQELMESLQAELSQREVRIGNLERLVNDFKEQYLSGEYLAVSDIQSDSADDNAVGQAYSIMSRHLEGLMGVAGGAIVEQVYQLTCVPNNADDSASIEMVYEALQDSAQTFAQGSEAEAQLPETLQACWNELSAAGLLTGASAPVVPVETEATTQAVQESTGSQSETVEDFAVEIAVAHADSGSSTENTSEVSELGAVTGALVGLETQEAPDAQSEEFETSVEEVTAEAEIAPVVESASESDSPEDLLAQLTGALEEHEVAPEVASAASETVELPAIDDAIEIDFATQETVESVEIEIVPEETEAAPELLEVEEAPVAQDVDVFLPHSETTEIHTPAVEVFGVEIAAEPEAAEEVAAEEIAGLEEVAQPEATLADEVGALAGLLELELDVESAPSESAPEQPQEVESDSSEVAVEAESETAPEEGASLDNWRAKLAALLQCQQILDQDPANEQALNQLVDALDSEAWTGRESEFEVYLARVAEDLDDGLHSFLEALTAKPMNDVFEHLQRFGLNNAELKAVSEFLSLTAESPRSEVISSELKLGVDGRGVNRDQVEEIVSEEDQKTVELLLESLYPKERPKLAASRSDLRAPPRRRFSGSICGNFTPGAANGGLHRLRFRPTGRSELRRRREVPRGRRP